MPVQVLSQEDIVRVLGPRPFTNPEQTNYDRYMKGFEGSIVEGSSADDTPQEGGEDDEPAEEADKDSDESVKVIPGFGSAS